MLAGKFGGMADPALAHEQRGHTCVWSLVSPHDDFAIA